jgi:hypothetical protein
MKSIGGEEIMKKKAAIISVKEMTNQRKKIERQ